MHNDPRAERAQIVHEVERETIVVVDQDDHAQRGSLRRLSGAGRRGQAACWAKTEGTPSTKPIGLLSAPRRTGKPAGFLGGPEQGLGLLDAFLLLERGIGI